MFAILLLDDLYKFSKILYNWELIDTYLKKSTIL